MNSRFEITGIHSREILDSRGDPTVETEVTVNGAITARASVPSGASTGAFEAYEMRDGDRSRYSGKGVLKAVDAVNGEIAASIVGMDVLDQRGIDGAMCRLDGTPNKARLGANSILSVSLACARAAAVSLDLPLYTYLGGCAASLLPMPMMNVLNGGAHASNSVDIQEFMIVPISADTFSKALRMCSEVFHALRRVVPHTGVGDEGGFAPDLERDEDALKALVAAIGNAGYTPGRDVGIAIDAAASEWYSPDDCVYRTLKKKREFSRGQLVDMWCGYVDRYPIVSLEDGMAEDDWEGWRVLTEKLGGRVQLVGDDLFVTSRTRLERGVKAGAGNSILIKPNQIGTLTETLDTLDHAKRNGYTAVVSHRSGETEDDFIADLAVASGAGQIKSGAPSRMDRVAKYNRLLRIEEELGASAVFAGRSAILR